MPLEHALWIFAGGRSTGKGQPVTGEGDTYFGILQGVGVYGVEESMPISSTVSTLAICQGIKRTNKPQEADLFGFRLDWVEAQT